MRQILLNLLTHSIKFTEGDGHVTISSDTGETVTGTAFAGPGPWIYARVEDTGRGIPSDRLNVIFEPIECCMAWTDDSVLPVRPAQVGPART